MLEALQITTGKNRGRRSPVATAKALHLCATATEFALPGGDAFAQVGTGEPRWTVRRVVPW